MERESIQSKKAKPRSQKPSPAHLKNARAKDAKAKEAKDTSQSEALKTLKQQLKEHGIAVADSITILAPATQVYEFWRNLTNLPKVFNQLQSVHVLSQTDSRWFWRVLKNQATVHWDSRITEDIPGVAISWQTMGAAEVQHAGTVRFTELPYGRGTVVDIKLVYLPPGGKTTDLIEKVLGESPYHNLKANLKKLREIIETGEIPTTEGQPHGLLH